MNKNKLTIEEVKHVADLANLTLTDQEIVDFQNKLSATLEYVKQLNEVDTSSVEPTSQVSGKINELREDRVKPSLSQEEALFNATSHNGLFVSKVKWN